jgi:hypothetical protein
VIQSGSRLAGAAIDRLTHSEDSSRRGEDPNRFDPVSFSIQKATIQLPVSDAI